MTVKSAKDILTGDTATLVARALIILGLTWNGIKQDATKENTDDIKTSLAILKVRQDATEQRISRNEILDGADHSNLKTMIEQDRRSFQEFKEKYFYNQPNTQP